MLDFSKSIFIMSYPSRAIILSALMGGKKLPSTFFSNITGLSTSTVSFHLKILLKHNLIKMYQQGKNHYYYIENEKIAELIESIQSLTPNFNKEQINKINNKYSLSFCMLRKCYNHFGGAISTKIFDFFLENNLIIKCEDEFIVTKNGYKWLKDFELDTSFFKKTNKIKVCLDCTERKFHIGGILGAEIVNKFTYQKWVKFNIPPNRIINITHKGRLNLKNHFNIVIKNF